VAAAVCGGCGKSAPLGIGVGATGATCADYATSLCQRIQSCAPAELPTSGLPTMMDCVNRYEAVCTQAMQAPKTGLTAAMVSVCIGEIPEMPCPRLFDGNGRAGYGTPGCTPAGGTAATGGSCSTPWQCVSGVCSISDPFSCGACAPLGSLSPPLALGDPCTFSDACPANSYCDATTNVCTPLPALGAACDPSRVDICDLTGPPAACDKTTSTCTALNIEPPGTACLSPPDPNAGRCFGTCEGSGQSFTCLANTVEGQSCVDTSTTFCVVGTKCDNGVCAGPTCDGT
jgi:hypothetical protein